MIERLLKLTVSCALLSGCSYRAETLPRCFDDNVGPSLQAVKHVSASGAYNGGDVELRHTFCSTHEDRLAIAEKLLGTAGYSYARQVAELGSCTDVVVNSPLTAEAIQKQVTAFCGIASASRVTYGQWSGSIGDRFLFVSGDYISFTGLGELPKPLQGK